MNPTGPLDRFAVIEAVRSERDGEVQAAANQLELAAALGIGKDAGRALVGEALELAYRLPRLWELVQALRVPAWRARSIARETVDLSAEAAAFADRLIAADPGHISA